MNGLRAAFPTITPKSLCPVISIRSQSQPNIYSNGKVDINNITIKNIINNPLEEITLATSVALPNIPAGARIATFLLNLFGPLPFNDFFDENGNVSLTPYLRAFLFTISIIQSNPSVSPVISQEFVINILQNNIFSQQLVQPFFGTTGTSDINRGAFGIAIYCSNDITMNNININNIICEGIPNIVPSITTSPGLKLYPNVNFASNGSGKSWGIFVDASDNIKVDNANIDWIISKNSDAFGIHLTSEVTNNLLQNIKTSNIISKLDIGYDPVFNPPSTSYGILVDDDSNNNQIACTSIERIIAPRTAVGIEIENAGSDNTIINSCVNKVIAKSKISTSESGNRQIIKNIPKTATGYISNNSSNTNLKCVVAKNIIIANEKSVRAIYCDNKCHNSCPYLIPGPSNSMASGISLLNNDKDAKIYNPEIYCLFGGLGNAENIHSETDNYEIIYDKCCCDKMFL